MALTKSQILQNLQSELNFTKNQSIQTLAAGEHILISGFGKFSVHSKSQRRGRNPYTGDSLMLKPRRVVAFKCSGKLRGKLNGN